jgi:hypothetical protein
MITSADELGKTENLEMFIVNEIITTLLCFQLLICSRFRACAEQ